MRCERGSVTVVSPASSLFLTSKERSKRIIGMDIHRVAPEVVALRPQAFHHQMSLARIRER
jgi:hypothetical protein